MGGWTYGKPLWYRIQKARSEKVDADVSAADQWISTTLLDILLQYTPDDIYNADETGLYWHALPNPSYVFKEGQLSGGKIARMHNSVGLR